MSSYQTPNQSPRSSVYQKEINRLLMEVERLRNAEQGVSMDRRPTPSISVPTGPPKDFALKEQPSSSRVSKNSAKRVISVLLGTGLVIALVTGIVSLVRFLQTSDVSFSQGNNNAGSQAVYAAELESHNSASDCWVVYHGNVYDVTSYANRHPAGASWITNSCGTDGTSEYARFHAESLLRSIQGQIIGSFSESSSVAATQEANGSNAAATTSSHDEDSSDEGPDISASRARHRPRDSKDSEDSEDSEDSDEDESGDKDDHDAGSQYRPTPSPTKCCGGSSPSTGSPTDGTLSGITMVEVARHNTRSDCWVVFYDDVYDLSTYFHPGSTDLCGNGRAGTDQTSAFAATGAIPTHNQDLLDQYVSSLWKGTLVAGDNLRSTPSPTEAPTGAPTTVTPKTPAPTVIATTPAPTRTAVTPAPTSSPTGTNVTPAPTVRNATPAPTASPTVAATSSSTRAPTASPTSTPTASPTASPTTAPTRSPTRSPTASPTGPTVPTISPTEMKSHSSNNDCWVAIDGTVYDLSSYNHPGGNLKKCGNDITSKYYSVNSPPHTTSLLLGIASYDIGILG